MFILFTDFGPDGLYTGQMRSVLHQACPARRVVEACNTAPAFNPRASAYLLASLVSFYPGDSVWVAVVDPGVGTGRDGLLMRADGTWFVGPDNGLLSRVAARASDVSLWRILWRPQRLSDSFHGRDWFAPIAARVALGDFPDREPMELNEMQGYDWPEDLAEVIQVDHYGNLMTGLRVQGVSVDRRLRLGAVELPHARIFAAVSPGGAFWYGNAMGLVEIAVNQGRADEALGAHIGATLSWMD